MKVYVILVDLENRYATLDKEVAKQLIKDEILDSEDDELDEQRVETFAQDMVDGNIENHYSDEFENICIWCDIMCLKEKIQIVNGK
jgi:hypothetical protein